MSASMIMRVDAHGRVPADAVRMAADVRVVAGVRTSAAGGSIGKVGAPRELRRGGRPADWRRPRSAPSGSVGAAARVSTAGHHREPGPALSNGWVVAIAAAALLLLGGAAVGVRSMGVVDTATTVGVVQVEPGDTLGSIAVENAPGLDVGQVVGQIRAMNGLSGTQVRVGQSLRVPVTAGR